MERKKDQKISSETNDILRKEEQNGGAKSKTTGASSPANDIAPSSNHQHPPVLQWPYQTQTSMEQPLSSSGPFLPTYSQSPFAVGQCHQSPNPNSHPGPPAAPLWLLPRPGYHFPGVNSPVFQPLGTTNVSWQVPGVVGGGVAFKEHHLAPNMCYPYPTFPGPWDPSSYFSEAYRYFSSQPPIISACTASLGQSIERGVIRTPIELSQKHQQLWEAQSTENVQLWTVIGQLKSEIGDYKSRILKLENEVSSLKQLVEEPRAHVIGSNVSGQASKRGRPKRSVGSIDAVPSSDDYKPRTRRRKPASMLQTENKSSVLNKVQYKEKACNATAIAGKEGVTASSGSKEGGNRDDQILPELQVSAVGLNPSVEMKSTDAKSKNLSNPFTALSQQAQETVTKGSIEGILGPQNGEHIPWPGRNVLNIASQGFYNSNGVINQGGKMVPGWDFVNEEEASDDVGTGSLAKDGNEEMVDDGSSDAEEEIARAQAEALPQFSDW